MSRLGTRPEPGSLDPAGRTTASASAGAHAGQLRIRRAAVGDREALTRMFERCSGRTGYERFHGYTHAIPDKYLTEALSGIAFHYALVACAAGDLGTGDPAGTGDVLVGLASCRVIAEGLAELGILVEDRWQRQGTGGRLLRELVLHADRVGLRALKAQILSDQAWIIAVLRRYGTCHSARGGYGILDVTLRLTR
jgi:GNAT superfamily N-acetyltransferase